MDVSSIPLMQSLLVTLILLHFGTVVDVASGTTNLGSVTCDNLRDTGPVDACRFSVVTKDDLQVKCIVLSTHKRPDGLVKEFRRKLLTTITFRVLPPTSKDTEGVFCASLLTARLQVWSKEYKGNYSAGQMPAGFFGFFSLFTDDSYAFLNFRRPVPVAKVHVQRECRGLPRDEMRENCIEKLMFLNSAKQGPTDDSFTSDEFWSAMKRHYVSDLGGEFTELSVTSSGILTGLQPNFFNQHFSTELHMKELTLAKMKLGSLQGPLVSMPSLQVMRLVEDDVTAVSAATLKAVPGLLELDLTRNHLENLPETLPRILESLNVSRNSLAALKGALPETLISLNVSQNAVEALPEALPSGLQTLDVSHNKLGQLPQQLPPALRLLDASHNHLRLLPDALPAALEVLQVSHNLLLTLGPKLLVPVRQLQLLDASNNALTSVVDVWLSHQLLLLNVSGNALQHISLLGPGNVTHLDASENIVTEWKVRGHQLTLVGNPRAAFGLETSGDGDSQLSIDLGEKLLLNCDPCAEDSDVSLHLRTWLIRQQNNASLGGPRVVRPTQPVCTDPQEHAGRLLVEADDLDDSSGCPGSPRYILQFSLLLITVLAVIGAFAALCYYRRYEITYVVHLIKMRRQRVAAERRNPSSYKYDAFVCYSSADRPWVVGELLPMLEHPGKSPDEPAVRLCLHERDFPLGTFIADNIICSMRSSRSTVVVLSQAFVDSQWCRWELDLASSKVHHLVLLELHRLERGRLPRHLRYLMDTRTYLEWPAQARAQPAMWKRLRAALAAPTNAEEPSTDDQEKRDIVAKQIKA